MSILDSTADTVERTASQIHGHALRNLRGHIENAPEKDLSRLALLARCTMGEPKTLIGPSTRTKAIDIVLNVHRLVPRSAQPGVQASFAARIRDMANDRIPLLIMLILPEQDCPIFDLRWCSYVPQGLSRGGEA